MKGLSFAGVFVVGLLAAVAPMIGTVYAEAYPADPARAAALSACGAANPHFDRLSALARTACYEHFLTLPAVDPAPPGSEAGRRMMPA